MLLALKVYKSPSPNHRSGFLEVRGHQQFNSGATPLDISADDA